VTLDETQVSTNLNDFFVRIPITLPGNNIDEAVLEVSTSSAFPQTATFRQVFQAPTVRNGFIVLDADAIRVPNFDRVRARPSSCASACVPRATHRATRSSRAHSCSMA
jgi:hypothetical protein